MISELNQEAFLELYDKHNKEIYNYILGRVGYSVQTAEDLTQDVFLKAWNYRKRYTAQKSSLRTWIFVIAKRILIDYFRGNSKHRGDLGDKLFDTLVASNKNSINEEVWDLEKAMLKMDPDDKEIIELKYRFEFSIIEISRIVNKSNTAVKVKIHRAKKKLLKLLESENEK